MNGIVAMAEALEIIGVALAKEWRRRRKPAPRPRGATLRPGAETPLWNALVDAVAPLVRQRGAKALLARELAVDRSRISEYFVRCRSMPDAERTLELLIWLARQRRAHPASAKR